MRIILDTDVASNLLKNRLDPILHAKIAPHEAAISFVTVGELMKWTHLRDFGDRGRQELHAFVASRPTIPGGRDVGRKWGEITAYATRRGRPRPVNDSWIAACCLTYELPLATLNEPDFRDYAEFEGLELLTRGE